MDCKCNGAKNDVLMLTHHLIKFTNILHFSGSYIFDWAPKEVELMSINTLLGSVGGGDK